jgi:inner membrane protein involved in colicin E2 resistance
VRVADLTHMRWKPGLGFFLAAVLVGAVLALWTGLGDPPVAVLAGGLVLLIALLAVAEHRHQ